MGGCTKCDSSRANVCVCCASAGGSAAMGARVPLVDETAFGWEEAGEEEGEEEGEAPARVELD